MTTAEHVAAVMGNDGSNRTVPGTNRTLDQLCTCISSWITRYSNGETRYKFADGSAILDTGTVWDIESATWRSTEDRAWDEGEEK